jgi:hypothetical protein
MPPRNLNPIAEEPEAMGKYLIEANFHVFVSQGDDKPERKATYSKGMVVEAADIPQGQSAADWVAKGLAKAA